MTKEKIATIKEGITVNKENNEIYFKYNPRKINYRQKNKFSSDNPFNVLNQINFD